MLEGAGPRFSRAGKDFFREREKAVSGTEWDDLHKAGWAKSHDGRSLGRDSRGGRPLLLPTHTWKKGRECRLPPQATGHAPTARWAPPALPGCSAHYLGVRTRSVAESQRERRPAGVPPRLAPGGSPSLLQRVQPSLSVSPEHSLLATNRIKRSGSPHNCLPPETVRTQPRKGKMTKEKREAWFPPTQTAQWPGGEAWFSGHPGHPDTIQADTPRVRIWLSLPYLLLHKELSRTGSHLTLQFSEALGCAHTWLRTEMRAPAPCLLTPCPKP